MHITDPHFVSDEKSKSSWLTLVDFLQFQFPAPSIDFLCISGDLADKHKPGGHEVSREILPLLASAIGVPGEAVFLVPGNHDLDRLQASLFNSDPTNLSTRLAVGQVRSLIQAPFSEFIHTANLIKCIGGNLKEQRIFLERLRLEILLFNSAWLCRDSTTDHGKLSCNLDAWEQILRERIAVPNDVLRIGLIHHAPSWLDPIEGNRLERFLARHVDLVLCGHEHAEHVRSITCDGQSFLLVTGASAGVGDFPHHRVLIGEISCEGELFLHRIARDPHRAGTGDEWFLSKSNIAHSLRRVDESAMRRTRALPANDPGTVLRLHWLKLFRSDVLDGFDRSHGTPDLLQIFRRLSLAKFATGHLDDSQTTLWQRLSDLNRAATQSQIASKVISRYQTATITTAQAGLTANQTHVLTGNRENDIATIVDHVFQRTTRELLNRQIESNSSDDPTYIAEILTTHLPSLIDELTEAIRRSFEPIDKDFWILYSWLAYLPQLSLSEPIAERLRHLWKNICKSAVERFVSISEPNAESPPWSTSRPNIFNVIRLLNLSPKLANDGLASLISGADAITRNQKLMSDTGVDLGRYLTTINPANQDPETSWTTLAEVWRRLTPLDRTQIVNLMLSDGKAVLQDLAHQQLFDALRVGSRTAFESTILQQYYRGLAFSTATQDPLADLVIAYTTLLLKMLMQVDGRVSWEQLLEVMPSRLRAEFANDNQLFILVEQLRQRNEPAIPLAEETERLVIASYRVALEELQSMDSLTVEEAMAASRALAILGGPGSGKTTLLRQLCLTCGDTDLPVFVPLREWNRSATLSNCINAVLEVTGYTLIELTKCGRRVLLMLDGLDEVSELSHEKQSELEALMRLDASVVVIITSRFSTIAYLPVAAELRKYALNRLSQEDITQYLELWFANSPQTGILAKQRVMTDPILREVLRAPFALRMFVTLLAATPADTIWKSRRDMYGRITGYLLDDRDRSRGLVPLFSLSEKRHALAALSRRAFEQSLTHLTYFDLLRYIGAVDPGEAQRRGEALLSEIVQRSGLLVRISDTSFDFSHWTVREFFAAESWLEDGSWRHWSSDEDRRYLTQESIPRFLLGADNVDSLDSLCARVAAALFKSPLTSLTLANLQLEVFKQLGDVRQAHYLEELLSAAQQMEMTGYLSEFSSLVAQMFHGRSGAAPLTLVLARIETVAKASSGVDVIRGARFFDVLSLLESPDVAAAICQHLIGTSNMLGVEMRRTLASMPPELVGTIVSHWIDHWSDLELLRACIIRSSKWTSTLNNVIRSWLSKSSHLVPTNDVTDSLIDPTGISGPPDQIATLIRAITSLVKDLFNPQIDSESSAILARIDPMEVQRLKGKLVERGTSGISLPIRLVEFTSLLETLRDHLQLTIKVVLDPGESRTLEVTAPPCALIIDALSDAADDLAVRLLLEVSRSSDIDNSQCATAALRTLLQRYIEYVPRDVTQICQQVVDDLWVSTTGSKNLASHLVIAKGKRAERAKDVLGISKWAWEGIMEIASKLPRRPEFTDWTYLQHRFSGLFRAAHKAKNEIGHLGLVGHNIVSDQLFTEVYEVARVSR